MNAHTDIDPLSNTSSPCKAADSSSSALEKWVGGRTVAEAERNPSLFAGVVEFHAVSDRPRLRTRGHTQLCFVPQKVVSVEGQFLLTTPFRSSFYGLEGLDVPGATVPSLRSWLSTSWQ
jgi:hypothetical protein